MRLIRTSLLLGTLVVPVTATLGGCAVGEARSRSAYVADLRHDFDTETVRVHDVVAYRGPAGDRRYRLFGSFEDPETGQWHLRWGEYGRTTRSSWRAIEEPVYPTETVDSPDEAAARSRAQATAFRASLSAEAP